MNEIPIHAARSKIVNCIFRAIKCIYVANQDSLPVALSALSLYVADKMFSWMKLTHISMYFVSNLMKCNLILGS